MAAQDYVAVVQQLYVSYFGRPADYYGLKDYTAQLEALGAPKTFTELTAAVQQPGNDALKALVNSFNSSPEAIALYGNDNSQIGVSKFVNAVYRNVLNRDADLEGLDFWVGEIVAGRLTRANAAAAITEGALSNTSEQGLLDKATVENKTEVATNFTAAIDTVPEINGFSGDEAAATARNLLADVTNETVVEDYQATVEATLAQIVVDSIPTTTASLTVGLDTLTGGAGNDTFNATEALVNGSATGTLTSGDKISGGAGTDSLNITQSGNFGAGLVNVSVTNVENVNLTTAGTATINTTDWTGVTALNINSAGVTAATAAATTNVTATNSGGGTVTITGGLDQTVTTVGGVTLTGAAGAITTTSSDLAANNVSVNGGTTVAVTANGQTTGTITVGNTAAPTGAVTVAATGNYTAGANNTTGAVAVTGGSTVSVTLASGITEAEATAAATEATNFTETFGSVTVTGGAATTAVTVNQADAVARVNSTGTNGKIGVANGAVVITDKNAASTTAAGTITTVTLKGFGTVDYNNDNDTIDAGETSVINSSALTTLNLSGTGTALTVTNGSLTTAAVTAQTLNLSGLTTTGAITLDTDVTTLTVNGSTAASEVNSLVASNVKTLTIGGDAAVTLTGQTIASDAAITVTNTAGATLGSALGTNASFTGGAGADSIILTASFTKAITMGDGDDIVTYAAQVTGGSVAAGNGNDTIVMTDAQADAADANSTFNAKFTGFEALQLSTLAGTKTIDLLGLNNVRNVSAAGGGTVTLNNFASNGTFTLTGNSTAATIGVAAAAFNPADVINIALSKVGILAAGTITADGVETVNINTADASAAGSAAAIHTLTLVDDDATSIVVTGNNGLNLTNAGNTAVTSFDASGVVANGAASVDTPANLGVTFTSANTTAAVSIKGGAGNDVLTGNAGVDTILGGAGADTIGGAGGADILTGGEGADVITGGAGNDTINLAETTDAADVVVLSASSGIDTINGFAAGAGLDAIELVSGSTTAATVSATAVFGSSTNVTLVEGAVNFALTGASSTTSDIVEINATLSSFGNLGAAGVVDGTELLKGLSSVNVAAAGLEATTAGDDFYVVAYQNGNAYLYEVANGGDTTVIASEISLVGVINGVAAGAFVSGDFTVGA